MAGPAKTNVQIALELTEVGMKMRAERYRREHPEASEDDVKTCVSEWLLDRPGAPDGDSVGRPRPVPPE